MQKSNNFTTVICTLRVLTLWLSRGYLNRNRWILPFPQGHWSLRSQKQVLRHHDFTDSGFDPSHSSSSSIKIRLSFTKIDQNFNNLFTKQITKSSFLESGDIFDPTCIHTTTSRNVRATLVGEIRWNEITQVQRVTEL